MSEQLWEFWDYDDDAPSRDDADVMEEDHQDHHHYHYRHHEPEIPFQAKAKAKETISNLSSFMAAEEDEDLRHLFAGSMFQRWSDSELQWDDSSVDSERTLLVSNTKLRGGNVNVSIKVSTVTEKLGNPSGIKIPATSEEKVCPSTSNKIATSSVTDNGIDKEKSISNSYGGASSKEKICSSSKKLEKHDFTTHNFSLSDVHIHSDHVVVNVFQPRCLNRRRSWHGGVITPNERICARDPDVLMSRKDNCRARAA